MAMGVWESSYAISDLTASPRPLTDEEKTIANTYGLSTLCSTSESDESEESKPDVPEKLPAQISDFKPQRNGNRYVTDPTKTCDYIFQRGTAAGQQCKRYALKGYHHCSSHWRNS